VRARNEHRRECPAIIHGTDQPWNAIEALADVMIGCRVLEQFIGKIDSMCLLLAASWQ